jgi:hypothetical protein
MDDSKNNHYYVGGKLYIIPKIIADIMDQTQDRLTKERDKLRAENEKLKIAFREIAKASSKYKVEGDEDGNNNYWEWDDNSLDIIIEIDKIVEKALNEVTK